jgi:hypothetical protein
LTVRFVVVIAIVPRFMMTVEFYLFNPLHILIMCANIRL